MWVSRRWKALELCHSHSFGRSSRDLLRVLEYYQPPLAMTIANMMKQWCWPMKHVKPHAGIGQTFRCFATSIALVNGVRSVFVGHSLCVKLPVAGYLHRLTCEGICSQLWSHCQSFLFFDEIFYVLKVRSLFRQVSSLMNPGMCWTGMGLFITQMTVVFWSVNYIRWNWKLIFKMCTGTAVAFAEEFLSIVFADGRPK